MKIVVLDGYAMNPGDMDWSPLTDLGECDLYDRTPPELVVPRLAGAAAAVTNKVVLSERVMSVLPELRYIGVTATGFNIVDTAAARARGITVTNVPAYSTMSVVQMTFAHLLNLTLRVADHGRTVRQGRWGSCPDFCFWDWPLVELDGLTMGIVGLGAIGRAVAKVASAMGMSVLAFDKNSALLAGPPGGVEFVELDELFARSDAVSLHCPLTDETRNLVDARRLALMKPTAYLINTARGPIVDLRALAAALAGGRLAGAGLDVLPEEPPRAGDNIAGLLDRDNCFITPHIAWATRAARQRLLAVTAANLAAFINGKPVNVVN
jgi:glycerate dehydrogenase